jgi:cytochrome b561
MVLKNTSETWGTPAKLLHWLVAIGLFTLIYYGLLQSDMERGPERSAVRETHASLALLVFVLMTVRLGWRFLNETPATPEGTPGWQRAAASVVHWGLYFFVFLQIIAGAMTVATGGRPLPFFGLFTVPLPVAEDSDSHHFWEEVHECRCGALRPLRAEERRAASHDARLGHGLGVWARHSSAMRSGHRSGATAGPCPPCVPMILGPCPLRRC